MHKRFSERERAKRKEPKTTLIEKVFILTFSPLPRMLPLLLLLGSKFPITEWKIIFHKLFDNMNGLKCVVCVCVQYGKEIKHFLATKLITKFYITKTYCCMARTAWNFQNVSRKISTYENFHRNIYKPNFVLLNSTQQISSNFVMKLN